MYLDTLSNLVYQDEYIENAREYVRGRGLDPDKLEFPWTRTDGNKDLFTPMQEKYPVNIFQDSLYIPITSIDNPNKLEAFDVRYLSNSPHRVRWFKFYRDKGNIVLYNFHDVLRYPNRPLIVTESIIDAESIKQLGMDVNVVSPLRAMFGIRLVSLLLTLSKNILLCYDNDEGGKKAATKIAEMVDTVEELKNNVRIANYSGKDPNDHLLKFGADSLRTCLEGQILWNNVK